MVHALISSITRNIFFLAPLLFLLLLTGSDAQGRIRGGKTNLGTISRRSLQSTDNEPGCNNTKAMTCKKKWEECTTTDETCGDLICVKTSPLFETGYAAEASSCSCLKPVAKNMADLHYVMLQLFFVARSNFNEGIDENPFLDLLTSMPILEKIPRDVVLFGDVGRLCIAMDLEACEYSNNIAARQTYGTAIDLFDENMENLFEEIRSETSGRRLQASQFFPQVESVKEDAETFMAGRTMAPSAPFICPSPGPTLAPTPAPSAAADPTTCLVSTNSGSLDIPPFEYYKKIKSAYGNARKVNQNLPDIPMTPKDAVKAIANKLSPEKAADLEEDDEDLSEQIQEASEEIEDGDSDAPEIIEGEEADLGGGGAGESVTVAGGEDAGGDLALDAGEDVAVGVEADADMGEAAPVMLVFQAAALEYWVDDKITSLPNLPDWLRFIGEAEMKVLAPFKDIYHWILKPVKILNKIRKYLTWWYPWKFFIRREKKKIKKHREERNSGAVEFWTGSCWTQLHDNGWSSGGKGIDAHWKDDENYPWIAYGLHDGAVMQYNGFNQGWTQLQDSGGPNPQDEDAAVNTLQANFIPNPNYQDMIVQVVVGMSNGAVFYWTGNAWRQLQDDGWKSAVMFMSVQFASESDDNQVRIVVGLENSSIQWWNGLGSQFIQLHDDGWDTTLTSMDVGWQDAASPQIVLGLENGDVMWYDIVRYPNPSNPGWNQLRTTTNCRANGRTECAITHIKGQFFTTYQRIVMAGQQGWVWYYDEEKGAGFETLHDGGFESDATGFCAQFPPLGNTADYPQVVLGLADAGIQRMDAQMSWSEILENKDDYGVENMECDFRQENDEDLSFVVTFTNGEVGMFPTTDTCAAVEYIQGTGWDNQMQVMSVDFHSSGNKRPRFVGGLNVFVDAAS